MEHAASLALHRSTEWMECVTPSVCVVDVCHRRSADDVEGLDDRVRHPVRPSLVLSSVLRSMHQLCGDVVLEAMSVLERRGSGVCFGFATMGRDQTCRACDQWRVLRTVCLFCGADHRWV